MIYDSRKCLNTNWNVSLSCSPHVAERNSCARSLRMGAGQIIEKLIFESDSGCSRLSHSLVQESGMG